MIRTKLLKLRSRNFMQELNGYMACLLLYFLIQFFHYWKIQYSWFVCDCIPGCSSSALSATGKLWLHRCSIWVGTIVGADGHCGGDRVVICNFITHLDLGLVGFAGEGDAGMSGMGAASSKPKRLQCMTKAVAESALLQLIPVAQGQPKRSQLG